MKTTLKSILKIGIFIPMVSLLIQPNKANAREVENYCYGLDWKYCNGKQVIRCTCTGSEKCYASWQELC